MTDTRTYHWKNLSINKKYVDELQEITTLININDVNFEFLKHYDKINESIERFTSEYDSIRISNRFKKLIDDLLSSYNLNSTNEFYVFSATIQKVYIDYYNNPVDIDVSLVEDYQDAQKELRILFEALKLKMNTGKVRLHSVNLGLNINKKVNNFFVMTEILEGLIKAYKLTDENFEEVLNEELDKYINYRLKDLDELYKWEIATEFYHFISKLSISPNSSNRDVKFVGIFFLISQIPVNKKNRFEIPTVNDINKFMDTDLTKYLTGFIKRPKQFFIKSETKKS